MDRSLMTLSICCLFTLMTSAAGSHGKTIYRDGAVQEVLNSGYDKGWHGNNQGSVEIKIGVYVSSILLNEDEGTMRMKVYFRQSWKDERILKAFEGVDEDVTMISISPDHIGRFWIPNTFVRNAINTESFTTAHTQESLLRVNKTGHFWYVHSLMLEVTCPELRESFTVMSHNVKCPIMFESYTYTIDDMYYSWLPNPVDADNDVKLLNYDLNEIKMHDCSQNYTIGGFPCLQLSMEFIRELSSLMIDIGVYLMSFILVLVSWYSFWLSPEREHLVARIVLAVGCVLTQGVYSLAIVAWYGRHGAGAHAVVVWLLGCWICSLLPLMELGMVYVLPSLMSSRLATARGSDQDYDIKHPRCAAVMDTIFGVIIMPVIFIFFNVSYWSKL